MQFSQKESKMQAKVKEWAEKRWGERQKAALRKPGVIRLICIKLTMLGMMGQAGHPDLAFWARSKKGKPFAFLIEMKKLGKESTELQTLRQMRFRLLKFRVYVADSVEKAQAIIEKEMSA